MTFFETCLAKPHGWLATLHSRLMHVGKCSRVDCFKLVALLLSLPIFHACDLLFKLRYSLGGVRLRHACRRQRLLGFENVLSELDLDLIDRRSLGGSIEGLQHSKARLEALECSHDFSARHHSISPAFENHTMNALRNESSACVARQSGGEPSPV